MENLQKPTTIQLPVFVWGLIENSLKAKTYVSAKKDFYTLKMEKTCLKKTESLTVMNKCTLIAMERKHLIQQVQNVSR